MLSKIACIFSGLLTFFLTYYQPSAYWNNASRRGLDILLELGVPVGYHRNLESSLTNCSLQQILEVDPEVIFVQTYPPAPAPLSQQLHGHPLWQKLRAVRNQQVYAIAQTWHSGNGTRSITLTLNRLLPLIYPHLSQLQP